MTTIIEKIKIGPSERVKYTRFELAKKVREQRESLNLSIEDVAEKYEVDVSFWNSIEKASRIFNVKIYNIIEDFLQLNQDELLAREVDDMTTISFLLSDEESTEIEKTIEFANLIFDELVLQEKIATN